MNENLILKIENLCVKTENQKNFFKNSKVDVAETFLQQEIIKNFSLELKKGSITGIFSPTGSGKTTLLNCIAGIPQKNLNISGQIELAENTVISYAFQDYRLLNNCTVLQNLMIPLENIKDISLTTKKNEALSLLQKMKLESKQNIKAAFLSGGEKQRLSLARALIYPSELLLLDEPFNALSEDVKKSVLGVVKEQLNSRSAIIISHDKNDLGFLCNSVIRM